MVYARWFFRASTYTEFARSAVLENAFFKQCNVHLPKNAFPQPVERLFFSPVLKRKLDEVGCWLAVQAGLVWQVGTLVGCPASQLVGWLTVWQVGSLAGWLDCGLFGFGWPLTQGIVQRKYIITQATFTMVEKCTVTPELKIFMSPPRTSRLWSVCCCSSQQPHSLETPTWASRTESAHSFYPPEEHCIFPSLILHFDNHGLESSLHGGLQASNTPPQESAHIHQQ